MATTNSSSSKAAEVDHCQVQNCRVKHNQGEAQPGCSAVPSSISYAAWRVNFKLAGLCYPAAHLGCMSPQRIIHLGCMSPQHIKPPFVAALGNTVCHSRALCKMVLLENGPALGPTSSLLLNQARNSLLSTNRLVAGAGEGRPTTGVGK